MAIECEVRMPFGSGVDDQTHTFEVVPRIGELIVLPRRHDLETDSYRVRDVWHYPHAIQGTSERVVLKVEPAE